MNNEDTIPGTQIPLRIQNTSLPKCILVDIDGTVASRNDRGPHDLHLVIEDFPKDNVINIVKALSKDYQIIFFTGRDEVCKEQTLHWLEINFFDQNGFFNGDDEIELFMRSLKDNRKDSIVKREMYEKHIEGKYYVEVVIDDRDQVVDMWRNELGLTCLQVDYGNF